MRRKIAKACLKFTGLFEAELLTELILRHWQHPCAEDHDYRSALLESAADVLRASVAGEQVFPDLAPDQVNLVAALWYAESVALSQPDEIPAAELQLRKDWLSRVNRAVPSCFCNPDELHP